MIVRSVRIAVAELNPTVGDLTANRSLVVEAGTAAAAQGAHLLVTGEMALTGYPIEDLALDREFVSAAEASAHLLAAELNTAGLGALTVITGGARVARRDDYAAPSTVVEPFAANCAFVVRHGAVIATYDKHHLPNYGVFDERRIFVAGDDPVTVDFDEGSARVGIAICEDLWRDDAPAARNASNTELVIALNASPFERGKFTERTRLAAARSREWDQPVVYCNLVGGQDELVFDGRSFVSTGADVPPFVAEGFRPAVHIVDVELPDPSTYTGPHVTRIARSASLAASGSLPHWLPDSASLLTDPLAESYAALVTGVHDYLAKNRVRQVVIGMSGGIDSALVAAIAADAIGGANCHGMSMPSRYSSEHSRDDAHESARRIGMTLETVSIEPMFEAFGAAVQTSGLAEENLQARIRGVIVMAVSNQTGRLVLATGNKTEIAVGYSTIYGDAVGGYAPIKDVPKTLVWGLARWRNAEAEAQGQPGPVPPRSIEKEPSAELRPDQLDADSLPEYGVLDAILTAHIEHRLGAQAIGTQAIPSAVATATDAGVFDAAAVMDTLRKVHVAEYKRRQYPPGPKITSLAFGRDRRVPITNAWESPPPRA